MNKPPHHPGIKIESSHGTVDFGITTLPNRKRPCLYRMKGAMVEPLAYFRSEEDAAAFGNIIGTIEAVIADLIAIAEKR